MVMLVNLDEWSSWWIYVTYNWTWDLNETSTKEFHMFPTGNIGNQTGAQEDEGAS